MLKGIKKAIGDYIWANGQGSFSPWYGHLMLDRGTGEVWTDTFNSLGHNEWKSYHDPAIIDLGQRIIERGLPVNMAEAKKQANYEIKVYKATLQKK